MQTTSKQRLLQGKKQQICYEIKGHLEVKLKEERSLFHAMNPGSCTNIPTVKVNSSHAQTRLGRSQPDVKDHKASCNG